jgi:PA14 domain/Chaperone of endosialidase
MVLIKNLTQTQINGIADNFKGEIITNTDTNKLMFNTGTEFTYLVYSDLNNAITGLSSLEATDLTGELQTAAQPNVTSLGTLTGLTVNNNLVVAEHNGVDEGLTLGGTLVTSTAAQLNYVNTTPGTAEAGKALVTDENNSIVGLTNLETDTLTVNGTLVTSSAIELNYVDVTTLGVAQASKALVVDADKNITGINTLEADYIQVNGTLVTSSAIELNYVDVATLGSAEASKALVVDANRDIGNIRNLTAENLTGTLQTAAQPNITSVGTLTSLDVEGAVSVGSLVVDGVPLNTFETGGLKMRVYSTADFNGRVIKADVLTTVNFSNYEPVTGVTENYSMEIWGYISPLYTESYTFTVSSNDKFRLWINNELVRVDWTDGTDTNLQTSPIALTANQWYPIYIQHSQSTGTEQLTVNWVSTSQVSELLPTARLAYDDKIVNVIARESYTQDSLNLYDSTNSNLSSLSTNTSGDLTLTAASSIVNIAGHNGSTTGLKLDGTLVTSTATELNYLDTTVGTAAASKAVVLDANLDYTGIRNITTVGNMGVNTSAPASQLEINSATGEVLRLTYDDANGSATNYADMTISSGGNLTINSSGNTTFIHSSDNLDIAGHDGSTLGLKLNGTLVTATATELNYVDTTAGTAEASKALVLDSSRDITNINSLSASTLTSTSTTDSTSTTTGAIKTAGGVGIVKNLNVGGVTELYNTTNATNADSGALVVAGGAGVKKALYVGEEGTTEYVGGTALGTNWTDRTPATYNNEDNTWLGVDWSSSLGMFAAATSTIDGYKIFTSTNGTSWTLAASAAASSDELFDMKWSPELGLFVAAGRRSVVGENTFIVVTSSNGTSWTLNAAPVPQDGNTNAKYESLNKIKIAYSPTLTLFVIANKNIILHSSNGTSWTEIIVPTTDYTNATWATTLNKFVAIGNAGVYGTSTNGTTWSHQNTGTISNHTNPAGPDNLREIAYSPTLTKFILIGQDKSYTSTTGESWTVIDSVQYVPQLESYTWRGLQWVSSTSQFIAVGYATGRSLLSSADGVTWTSAVGTANVEYEEFAFSSSLNLLVAVASYSLTIKAISSTYAAGTPVVTPADGYFNLKGDADITGGIDVEGVVNMNNATDSTTPTTGALIVDGGVGIAKKLNVGQTLTVTGDTTLSANVAVTGPSLRLPTGNTAARPTGVLGQVRYNSETSQFEGFGAGNTWGSLGGVTDVDQDTRISAETSAGADNDELRFYNAGAESMRLTATSLLGLGTSAPSKKLEINSATGDVLRLTYDDADGSATNFVDMTVSSGGNLTINSSGNTTFIHSSDNFDVAGHDGSTLGLRLAGVLVTATAAELNYVDTTAGTAEASKALVLDANRDIDNINVLTADTVNVSTFGAGELTADTINTTGNVGINTTDLTFGLQVNAADGNILRLTYNDDTSATPTSKAELTMDDSNNLTISASNSVNIATHNGSTTGLKLAGTLITSTATELNYVDTTAGTAEASKALVLDSSRDITNINSLSASTLTSTSTTDSTSSTTGAVQIAGGVGIAKSVFIGAASSGYLELSGDALFNGDVESSGVLTLSNATDATTTTTGAVKIAGGVGIVKSVHIGQTLTVGGNTTLSSNLTVDGPSMRVPVGDTAARPTGVLGQVRYNSETSQFEGFGAGSTWGSLGGVSDVDQDTKILAETSAGADDDELRFLNAGNETMRLTATSLLGLGTTAPDKKLEINSATGDVLRLTYNDANGSAANYVDMNVSSGGNLTINSSGNTTFIHSSDNLDVAGHDGSTLGLMLAGVLVTSTAAELNYVDVTTTGTAQASKALVLDANRDITNINSISMNSLNLTFDSATANTAGNPLTITRTTSGTPANGLGVGMSFKVENSANANIEFGNIAVVSSDITTTTEDGQFVVNLLTNGVMTESLRLSSTTLYANELYETSDRRVKENFNEISLQETHDRVMSLKLVDYNYIGQTKTRRGLIAQEVEEVIPVAVETENRNGIEDFKSVSNREITNHVVGSVQYLSAKLDETLARLEKLSEDFEAYKQAHP